MLAMLMEFANLGFAFVILGGLLMIVRKFNRACMIARDMALVFMASAHAHICGKVKIVPLRSQKMWMPI